LRISDERTASVELQCEYLLTYIMRHVFGVNWLWNFQRSIHVCNQFLQPTARNKCSRQIKIVKYITRFPFNSLVYLKWQKYVSRACSVRQCLVCVKVHWEQPEGKRNNMYNKETPRWRGISRPYVQITLCSSNINKHNFQIEIWQPTAWTSILQRTKPPHS